MRVCIDIATGRLIESQSGNDPATLHVLISNAIANGYEPHEINALIMDDAEAHALINSMIEAPPVQSVTKRQFYQQAAVAGFVTQAEALQAVGGIIPATIQVMIDALPSDEQFNARMLISGAREIHRDHPLTAYIADEYGLTSEQVDDFFVAAAQL